MPEFILQHWELTRAPQLAAVEFVSAAAQGATHQVRVAINLKTTKTPGLDRADVSPAAR